MSKEYVRSDGWGSVGDVLALAMNSAPSASLYVTSGGVDNGATWKEVVKICETRDQILELQFDADQWDEAVEV